VYTINGAKGLHCYGTITTSAGFTSTSDQSVKEDVEDVDLSPVFDAVSCKSYRRTDKPELGRRCGFIAQHVQSACTSAGVPDTFTHEMPQDDGTTLLGLDYARLGVCTWSKVKQLEARLRAIEIAIESAQ
jgi:hypothetical protein